jgi:hypothetical protein
MSDIFNQQKEMVQSISDLINKEKSNLDLIYSSFINKMGKQNPIHKTYIDIDELFLSKNPKAKDFHDNFKEIDVKLLYWYDMNEKKFINEISNYSGKIIKEYNFEIYLENQLLHTNPVKNIISIPLKKLQITDNHNRFDSQFANIYNNHIIYDHINELDTYHGRSTIIFYYNISDKTPNIQFKMYLDDHLNIIIPHINTIIIKNYTAFSSYVLYSVINHIDLSNIVLFNTHNETEKQNFEKVNNFINSKCPTYLTSLDQRKLFDDGTLFDIIFEFIDYNNIIDNIQPILNFVKELTIPEKKQEPKAIDTYQKDISIQELIEKNNSSEQLIIALEVDNKVFREEIANYKMICDKNNAELYKLHTSIIEYTENIQKVKLENLEQSRKLIEFDLVKKSIDNLTKEIEVLKISINDYKLREQKIRLEKQTIISKCTLQYQELEQLKKTLIELRDTDKLYNSTNDKNKKQILELTTKISEYDNIIITLKTKISELLEPKDNTNTIDTSYDKVLYEQIKDLQKDIEKYKKEIEKLNKENEDKQNKFDDFQNKMKSMLFTFNDDTIIKKKK